MKKLLIVSLVALLSLSCLAGCGKKDENKPHANSIKVGVSYDATTLDAAAQVEDGSGFAVRLISEGLLRSVNNEIGEGIADKWESSEDGLTWTFHLKETKFSDGTAVTANDVAYAVIRVLTPENGLANASDSAVNTIVNAKAFANGEATADQLGITVVDDYNITFTYESPADEETFTSVLFAPVKQALVEEKGIAYGSDANAFIGNGPFAVTEWAHDSSITFTKNENYWDAANVSLDSIVSVVGATGDTAVDMISTKTLDVASFSSEEQVGAAVAAGFKSMTVEGTTQFLHVNSAGSSEEVGKWLSNVNFRKALNAALDREALVATVYKGQTPATSLIPNSEYGVNDLFNKEYTTGSWSSTQDVEAAKKFLADAMAELNCTDVNEIPTFKLLAMESTGNTDALNAIADQWEKALGIKCELDMQTLMGMLMKVMSGNFDFWKGGNGIENDSFDYMGDYTEEDGYYGYADEQFEALYLAGLNAVGTQQRKDALAAIATYFTDNMMDLAITWQSSSLCYNSCITGLTIDHNNVDYRFAKVVVE